MVARLRTFLLSSGYHMLYGIFSYLYVTRFLLAFLLIPATTPASSTTTTTTTKPPQQPPHSGGGHVRIPLTLDRGSYIALVSFINMHLQYIFVAVVKDSLPAWKAAAFQKLQSWLPASCCSCCRGRQRGGCLSAVLSLPSRIPYFTEMTLILAMCFLWVPLQNLAGLAIYVKVVLSCYTLFILVGPLKASKAPRPLGARNSNIMAASASSSAAFPAAPPDVVTVVIPLASAEDTTVSRRCSASGRSGNLSSSFRASPSPSRSPIDSPGTEVSGSGPPCLLNSLAELVATVGIMFGVWCSDVSLDSHPAFYRLLLLTLLAGLCFLVGSFSTQYDTEMKMASLSTSTSGSAPLLSPPPHTPAPTRTFLDFVRAVRFTARRPSMQAMMTMITAVSLVEAFFRHFLIALLLVANPPGGNLPLGAVPAAVGAICVVTLLFTAVAKRLSRRVCPYRLGCVVLVLQFVTFPTLLLVGVGEDKDCPLQRFFAFFVLWCLWQGGVAGAFRAVLEESYVAVVVMEDNVVFRSHHESNSATDRPHIVEETCSLLVTVSKAAAVVVGCLIFWLLQLFVFPASVSEQEAGHFAPIYRRQVFQLSLILSVVGCLTAATTLCVWYQRFQLYGAHKEFIETAFSRMM